jgi:hypothetical protein
MNRSPITSLDDANTATREEGAAIRIQPPAPNATRYYWLEDGAWRFAKAGWNTARATDADSVRPEVKRHIERQSRRERNDLITAVDRDRVGAEA